MPFVAYAATWIVFTIASAWALGAVHACADLPAPNGLTYVALSRGPGLDVPAIQGCHAGAAPLFIVLAIGYAALTALWLRISNVKKLPNAAIGVFAIAIVCGVLFPYVSTSDPYAYALYMYEAGVLHLSPYAAHALPGSDVGRTLTQFFPDVRSDIRIMNYGPVFGLAYAGLGGLLKFSGLVNIANLIRIERVFSGVCVVVTALLLSRSRAAAGANRALVLVLTSPLLLIEGVCFAHADVLMLALLCAALLCWERERWLMTGIFIGLALGVRSVALFALLAATMYAYRNDRARLLPLWGGTALSVAITAALSWFLWRSVSFGGGAAIDPFGSPVAILVNLIGGENFAHTIAATGVQAALGLTFAALALLAGAYDFVPFGALAASPAVRPWYCQWLVPMAALRTSPVAAQMTLAIVSLAILSEAPLMIGGSKVLTIAVVAVQWGVPLTLLVLSKNRRTATRT